MVQGKVSKNFAVQSEILLCCLGNELGIGHSVNANGRINTLDPDSAVNDLLVFSSAVSVGKSFFVNVFRDGPNIFSFSPVSAGSLEDLFSACSGRYTVD